MEEELIAQTGGYSKWVEEEQSFLPRKKTNFEKATFW